MKKKELSVKLSLKKQNVASLEVQKVKGGNTADCPPPTLSCNCNPTNTCNTNGCGTNETCLTDAALSCTPRGCGNTMFNC